MAYTLADLVTFCERNGWTDESTGGETQLKSWINEMIQRLASMREWPFYRKDAYWVNLTAPYTTGTVAVTNGNTTVTGTGTSWASGMVGQEFYGGGDSSRIYEISAVNSTTELDLTAAFLGDTASGESYSIRYVRYDLPSNFDRKCGSLFDQTGNEISFVSTSLDDWHRLRLQGANTVTIPTHVCFYSGGPGQASTYQFLVHPAPSGARALRLPYQAKPVTADDSTAPDWPERFLYLLHMLLRLEMSVRPPGYGPTSLAAFDAVVERAYQRSLQQRGPYKIPVGRGRDVITEANKLKAMFTVS